MGKKFLATFLVISAFMLGPVFAAGNLNVTSVSLAPTYINTRTVTSMLNITMNSTNGNTTITSVNVTLAGNVTIGNVTGVFVLAGNGTVIASSTANSTQTRFTVSIPAGFNASSGANTSFLIAVNLTGSAVKTNLSVQINSSADFGTDSGSNVTLVPGFVNSTESLIQDLHANVSISPNFIDTGIINQTLVYTILPTGRDPIKNVTITVPSGYNLTNISTVELDASNITANTTTTAPNYVNVSAATPTTQRIKITFNVNSSSTRVNSSAFSSVLDGGNLTAVAGEATAGSMNVTTQQIINITNVAIAKGVAITNGTDYWEFNFTLGVTANLTGLVQFKMTNWTDASNNKIYLNTSSVSYSTLRTSSNFSDPAGKINVTEAYGDNVGINQTVTEAGTSLALILRMIIPAGTKVSSTWASTYSFLFRAYP